jgi:hypothetical protein
LIIKTYVSCRSHDYIIQIENRVLLQFELEEGRVVIEGFVNEINIQLYVVPKARTPRIKKYNRRVGRDFGATKMFNYENSQMAHTSASDFKVFTSINHVRFAHSWVDKKKAELSLNVS